jgi:hypothetical protein
MMYRYAGTRLATVTGKLFHSSGKQSKPTRYYRGQTTINGGNRGLSQVIASLETVVAFWTTDAKAHHDKLYTFKVFKPLQEVVDDDIPPAWMLEALAEEDSYECC